MLGIVNEAGMVAADFLAFFFFGLAAAGAGAVACAADAAGVETIDAFGADAV